jgi:hypothetical protein
MLATAIKTKRFQVLEQSLDKWLDQFTFISAAGSLTKYYDTSVQSFFTKGILISTDGQFLEIKSNKALLQESSPTLDSVTPQLSYNYQFGLPLDGQQKSLFEECNRVTGIRAPQPLTLKAFLRDNALRETVIIDATRRTYTQGTLILTVDEVYQHGTFLTFTDNDNGRSVELFEKEVDALVAPLSVKPMSPNYLTQIFQASSPTLQVKVNTL